MTLNKVFLDVLVLRIALFLLNFLQQNTQNHGKAKIMKQTIIAYHKDEENHWVAQLSCGHNQHVRHNPPWTSRPWVETQGGRDAMLGYALNCVICDELDPQ